MKRIIAPIVLLTFLFPALAYGVTLDDLVTQDEIVYKKSNTPYTGTTTGLFQYTYKDGIRNGPFRVYYKSGRLKEITETGSKKVRISRTFTMEIYGPKEPTKMVRKTVFGLDTTKTFSSNPQNWDNS